MGKLISRGELIRRLNVLYDTTTLQRTDEITKAFLDFRFLIMNAPTVEAKEVVHGEWVYDERKDIIYCNHCNNYALFVWDETSYEISELISDFCPHCGADMRKKV